VKPQSTRAIVTTLLLIATYAVSAEKTVVGLPHFTFLGVPESQVIERGLKAVNVDGQEFWIPDVD